MNRSALRAALKARLRIPSSGDGLLDDNVLNDCLGLALTDIAIERHWPWLLTSGTLSFTNGSANLPADWAHSAEFFVNGRRAKKANSLSHFLDIQADVSAYVWYEIGSTIQLAPANTTTLTSPTLYYYRNEPTMADDATSPLLPAEYHNTLIARASYQANMRRQNYDQAAQDLGEAKLGIEKMLKTVPARAGGPRTIRPSGVNNFATWA